MIFNGFRAKVVLLPNLKVTEQAIPIKYQNNHFSQGPRHLSLKQIEKSLHFSFKTVENFSNSKRRPPGKERWAKTQPSGSENVEIPGVRLGGWSGLELTDTLH